MNLFDQPGEFQMEKGASCLPSGCLGKVKGELRFKGIHREVIAQDGADGLGEEGEVYRPNLEAKNEALSFGNSWFWNEDKKSTAT